MDDKLIQVLFPRRSRDTGPRPPPPEECHDDSKTGALDCSYAIAGCRVYSACFAQRPEKDYLSGVEADKIRDAETPENERIKLFGEFAQDRLKKFQYELGHPSPNKHTEMLNYLMNSYIGCVDDAADIIQVGLEHQDSIREEGIETI